MSFNRLAVLALNYDLLLQYPINRLQGNAKILRSLDQTKDATLIAEETLTNEAFDIIEMLYAAERDGAKETAQLRQHDHRLKRLIPLLLYRYRPIETIDTSESENDEAKIPHTESNAMVAKHDRQTMQVLPFNFRPYNTGLCYSNWPLGRTKDVVVTAESAAAETVEMGSEIYTKDSNVYYIAEPTDKEAWVKTKLSDESQVAFDVDKFYNSADVFFQKYAPRARVIRKARFRSILPESRLFRSFLFDTASHVWDEIWQESFASLRYKLIGADAEDDTKRRYHLLANFLALWQPYNLSQFSEKVASLDAVLQFATRSWSNHQVIMLEQLLRATVYEKGVSGETASRKNCIVNAIVHLIDTSDSQTIHIRSATLLLFAALRSQFGAIFCDLQNNESSANIMLRIVWPLESALVNVDSTKNLYLTAVQLWTVAELLLRFLQTANVAFDSRDFVALFVKHVLSNAKENLFAPDLQNIDTSVTSTLEQNFIKK